MCSFGEKKYHPSEMPTRCWHCFVCVVRSCRMRFASSMCMCVCVRVLWMCGHEFSINYLIVINLAHRKCAKLWADKNEFEFLRCFCLSNTETVHGRLYEYSFFSWHYYRVFAHDCDSLLLNMWTGSLCFCDIPTAGECGNLYRSLLFCATPRRRYDDCNTNPVGKLGSRNASAELKSKSTSSSLSLCIRMWDVQALLEKRASQQHPTFVRQARGGNTRF